LIQTFPRETTPEFIPAASTSFDLTAAFIIVIHSPFTLFFGNDCGAAARFASFSLITPLLPPPPEEGYARAQ
jgi:hypothetical protein